MNLADEKIPRRVCEPLAVGGPKYKDTRAAKTKIALFVSHGMGQQLRFQTLDATVEGLRAAASAHGEIRTRTVAIGDGKEIVQRAEFEMVDAKGAEVEVHVYESYWAPLTEGKVTLRDVIGGLFRAGLNGLRISRRPFERWIFGRKVAFGPQDGATAKLLVMFAVLCFLVLMNFIIGLAAATGFFGAEAGWPRGPLLDVLTTASAVFIAASLLFAFSLWLATLLKPKSDPAKSSAWVAFTTVLQLFFYLYLALVIATGLVFVVAIIWDFADANGFSNCTGNLPLLGEAWRAPVWGLLFVVSWLIRTLIVQYLGDVIAYVSPHTLDRFMEVRDEIRETVRKVAHAIYSAHSTSDKLEYQRIGLIGHSLGSVVVYEALNNLINQNEIMNEKLYIVERTSTLVTFGSPLDKVAFIFALRWPRTSDTREALAVSGQPLIQNYAKYRLLKWINVYSKRDVIGGDLNFFDDKKNEHYFLKPAVTNVAVDDKQKRPDRGVKNVADDDPPNRGVKNVPDEDALIPLIAHVEHWKNKRVFEQLYRAL